MTARTLKCLVAVFALLVLPAHASDRAASLYQMHEKLLNQDGRPIDLDVYRGSPVLVSGRSRRRRG